MFSVSCGLMVNTEKQQSMTAISGLYSALKQFPFLCVHLDHMYDMKSMRRKPLAKTLPSKKKKKKRYFLGPHMPLNLVI